MRVLRRLLLAIAIVTSVAVVLPTSLGGATNYVTTYGDSMEPGFRAGDLAVIRSAGSYDVGDVVAYRSPELDRIVLHRIVDRDGDAFVFRGDNNDFLDAERLDSAHVIGRLAMRVPQGGRAMSWLMTPLHAAIVAVAASTVLGLYAGGRRRHRGPRSVVASRPARLSAGTAGRLRTAGGWSAGAGAALLLIGAFAFTRPTSAQVDETTSYTHVGEFGYSAASRSSVYPDGFTTGDPVFTRLADRVVVRFAHRVESGAPADVDASVAIHAVVQGAGGWSRSVELADRRPLDRDDAEVTTTIDLSAIRELAAESIAATGTAEGELRIAVTAVVEAAGTVAGDPIDDRFETVADFTLDDAALRLATPLGDAESITSSEDGSIVRSASRAAVLDLPLPGVKPPITVVRTVGVGAGAALLLLAAVLAVAGRPRAGRAGGEGARIAARYRKVLLPIESATRPPQPIVQVASIAGLLRVAKHHEVLVLHHVTGERHTFLVEAHGTTYLYAAGIPGDDVAEAEAEEPEVAPQQVRAKPRHARTDSYPAPAIQ